MTMDILYFVPYAPTSIRTRPYHLIRYLAERGHSITLATCWENSAEEDALEFFESIGVSVLSFPLGSFHILRNLLQAVLSGIPMQMRYSWQPALARQLMEHLGEHKYDVIHIEHFRGAEYGLKIKKRLDELNLKTPIVWDSVDCISHLFEQASCNSRSYFGKWVTRFELRRTRRWEADLISQFDRVLVTSPVDKQALEHLNGDAVQDHIVVLPNGVDLEYFTPQDTPRKETSIVFSGKLSYHANITAALYLVNEIMPLVWKKKPQVQVFLAGKDPDPKISALARRDARVKVTGTVEDLRPFLREASLAVAPMLYGAGIQNKVLEAMACGTPVVATPLAVSALGSSRSGEEIVIARNSVEFANSILKIIGDKEFGSILGLKGYTFVHENFRWADVIYGLEMIYNDLIKEKFANNLEVAGSYS